MHRNQSVSTHKFAMVPRADIPRSSFRIQKAHKTTFDAGYLIPVYVDEVLPGDTFNLKATMFARLATPIFPLMDNLYLDTFWFFVPNRLVWNNWVKFMGEQDNPTDTIDYTVPQCVAPTTGYAVNTLGDYMGLPTHTTAAVSHSALFFRAYNLIWNQWFRDENLQDSVQVPKTDGPDANNLYTLLRRGKRHDYFTSALPWTQKGDSVTLPLGGQAPVLGIGFEVGVGAGQTQNNVSIRETGGGTAVYPYGTQLSTTTNFNTRVNVVPTGAAATGSPAIYADLSQATATTINQLRQSFQIQKLLERDARGGTRYTEIVRSHFGVISPDARLQRAEYLGGNSQAIAINEVTQNQATDAGTTPLGQLAGQGRVVSHNGFTQSFTEHGMIIGLVSVRADLNYQQGLRRLWSRRTRYDYYFPVFAALGEQPIYNKEIYCKGDAADDLVFGYQERWAEYRYNPSQITGYFRSTNSTPLDAWHLAQEFNNLPTLNSTFLQENPPVDRIVAVTAQANGQQFLFDSFFDIKAARPMPMYGVPGLVDHF